ncbi:ABC-type amino acid transport system, permease component protein [Syntrophobacter sp. SbD1]|nr:ABC-type amino acid transport system, permease component protein [Syntrophobacter sp. SbD1]
MEFLSQFVAVYGSLINFIGINALLALSLYVTLSAGQLSLGNAAFAGIGAYTAGILTMHLNAPYPVSIAAGACMAAMTALLIGTPVLRIRGIFLAMATLAFGEVVRIAAVNLDITGGAQGLVGIPNKTTTLIIYGVLAATTYFLAVLGGSRIGWAFASIREDETAAMAMGINTARYKNMAFVLGAFIAGIAGAIHAHLNFIITPGEFGFSAAVQLLIYNVVGGTRSVYGPILGAVILTALPEVLRGAGVTAGPLRLGVNGAILLIVILYLPNGLSSLGHRWRSEARWMQRDG